MERRTVGGTGLELSRIVLGCGNFGGIGSAPAFFGQGESEAEAFRLMDAAWELGITAFDTADAYGGGRSETWIGRWRAQRGHRPLLATKVFHSVEGDPRDRGLAPERILRQIDGSLSRLGVERVDMYLIHEPDPNTPLAETLGALGELVQAGKVRAIGASNVDRRWLEAALALSERDGLARVEWVQNSYSLLDREAEREVLPLCAQHGLGFTPFGPLAGGWLTGKYRRDRLPPPGSRMAQRPEPYLHLDDDAVYRGLDALARVGVERGVDMPTLAFAWLLSNPHVDAVIAGPRRPEHLEPALAGMKLTLSSSERDELAALFPGEKRDGRALDETVTSLEMTSPRQLVPARRPPPAPLELEEVGTAGAPLLRAIYVRIGAPHGWSGRWDWSDADWAEELSRPGVRAWIARVGQEAAGLVELEAERDGDVGIVVFGLVPEFVGRGFGAALLTTATELAWGLTSPGRVGTKRVWVQTSSRDHPHALANYERRGFRAFRSERKPPRTA